MGLFHSGMNHWQRQWLSDRLHKKTTIPTVAQMPLGITPKPKRQTTGKRSAKNSPKAVPGA